MRQSFYLAISYLRFHYSRTLLLLVSIGIILFLPAGLQRLIVESETQMMARAGATPLVIGARGNATDLVINTLYFEQNEIDAMDMRILDELDDASLGYPIPLISCFRARGFPIVGTNLDYFAFRELSVARGRMLRYVGECLLGSAVADELGLVPGDSLLSSPDNFMDLAGSYPLQMTVVGILEESGTPDDRAVFTDLKTNWIIMGLGHGHQDMQRVSDPTLVLDRDSSLVVASPKLFIYNKVDGRDVNSFHFHGDTRDYPLSAVIFVPADQKGATLIRGRFKTGTMEEQIVIPLVAVDNLLQNIFRIKKVFNTIFLLIGLATLFILGLIVTLSLRLRKSELHTMFTIGSSPGKVLEIIGLELLVLILLSLGFALVLYSLAGLFVEEFIRHFII